MKQFFTLTFLIFFSFNTQAQLADGTIAPDFTATDINGVEYNLYDLLNEGKTVLMDVSATWCGPCWSFHKSGILESLWEEYGPDGTDELYIFFIEGDGSTSLADLNGTGNNTIGDWVTGTNYPIIDNASIAGRYNIRFFPTLYQICPDRTINRLINDSSLSPQAFYDGFVGCNELAGSNNVIIRNFEEYEGPTCGNIDYDPTFLVQNMGTETVNSMTIDILANGELVDSRNWSGEISSYEFDEIELRNLDHNDSYELEIQLNDINMMSDDVPENNVLLYALELPKVADNKGQVIINTDNYGEELYWILYSPVGQIVAKGGNEAVGFSNNGVGTHTAPQHTTAYGDNEEIIVDIDLDTEGCHLLLAFDYYGDGLCCDEGQGVFRIVDSNGENIIDISQSLESTSDTQFERLFFSNLSEIETITDLVVVPNPNNGVFDLRVEGSINGIFNLSIVDLQGKLVYQSKNQSLNTGRISINSNLEPGIYSLRLEQDQQITTKRVIVQN